MPAIERYTDYDPGLVLQPALGTRLPSAGARNPGPAGLRPPAAGRARPGPLLRHGQFTRAVSERGFQVTGIDGSEEMLRFARQNAPSIEFIAADARDFRSPRPCDCVFSVSEPQPRDIHGRLRLGSTTLAIRWSREAFGFDLNPPDRQAFQTLNKPYVITEGDNVCVALTDDDRAQIGRCTIHMYRRNGEWTHSEAVISQKCHSIEEVRLMLDAAGFTGIRLYDAGSDLGMSGDVGFARTFFTAVRP